MKALFSMGNTLAICACLALVGCQPSDTATPTQTQAQAEPAIESVIMNPQTHPSTEPNPNPITSPIKSAPAKQSLQGMLATVHKDENCGCCGDWIEHAEKHGMATEVNHPADMIAVKMQHGVPDDMRSCHTTVTDSGYVFEGHIPAKYVAQFLANPPADAIGLTVPGMPVGSPGMEYQDKFMAYDIMQINTDGSTQVYAAVDTPSQQFL